MLKSFRHPFTKDKLEVGFNLSKLHNAHVLHHWHLVGIPMISQQVRYAHESTVALLNLYEIQESGDEEKMWFAAVARKHQNEAARVIQ